MAGQEQLSTSRGQYIKLHEDNREGQAGEVDVQKIAGYSSSLDIGSKGSARGDRDDNLHKSKELRRIESQKNSPSVQDAAEDKAGKDRANSSEDRANGNEDRANGSEDRANGSEDRANGSEDRANGNEDRSYQTNNQMPGGRTTPDGYNHSQFSRGNSRGNPNRRMTKRDSAAKSMLTSSFKGSQHRNTISTVRAGGAA